MTKYICLLAIMFMCCCSSSEKNTQNIEVFVLRGPSAIAFAQWMKYPPVVDGKKIIVRMIDSPDLMQARLIKQNTGIAVLPMINAANLYNKGIHYSIAGCPVWGTLYLVEKENIDTTDRSLYIFGSGTTPDILTRYYTEKNKLSYDFNYSFATAREIMHALHIGKVKRAVLGEPFLSMALHRDTTLRIIADLNQLEDLSSGFAQTAVLYAPKVEQYRNKLDSLLDSSCRYANEKPDEAIRILENYKVFPIGMLTKESIERCRIKYLRAAESEENIYSFLQIINDYEPKAIGGKIPDKCFITSGK